MFSAVRFAPLLAISFCAKKSTEPTLVWVQFNGDEDVIDVPVTASDELGPAATIDLTSTTGEVIVGSATVDPSRGPVGSSHRITVHVLDSFSETVTKVEVEADAGDRGVQTLTLAQDSADAGVWVLDVTSQGVVGEQRTDSFAFLLWAAEPEPATVK